MEAKLAFSVNVRSSEDVKRIFSVLVKCGYKWNDGNDMDAYDPDDYIGNTLFINIPPENPRCL